MQIIASKSLLLKLSDTTVDVEIRLMAPEKIEDGHWRCRYQIDWPEKPRDASGAGANSMQALVLAMQMLGAELYASKAHKDGRLSGQDPGSGYGIPVPPNFRPDLIADDAKFL